MIVGRHRQRFGVEFLLCALIGLTLPPWAFAQMASQKLRCDVEYLEPQREEFYGILFAELEVTAEGDLDGERVVSGSMRFYDESDRPPDQEPLSQMTIAGDWSARVITFHNVDQPEEWFFAGVVVTDDGMIRMAGRELFLREEIAEAGVWSGNCVLVDPGNN